MQRSRVLAALFWIGSALASPSAPATELEREFAHPPASARPWVNWFWMDGNISREGITADLEAMQRVGIGGALLMDVTQDIPPGPVRFNQPQWHEMFKHASAEARRLGLELSLNNAPGWSGSGGPWITPELAMQKVVWSQTFLAGPSHFEGALNPLQVERDYLQPIATVAFPTLANEGSGGSARASGSAAPFRIPLHQAKTGMSRAGSRSEPFSPAPSGAVIARSNIVELTSRTDAQGRLVWDVPAGRWTVLRFGATATGTENHPVPPEGRGLECDKLSRKAIEAHFEAFLAPLIRETGGRSAAGFSGLHIDSWEVGFQNWTPRFREEFLKRRGYDLLKYLPTYSGRVVDSLEISERFLWDVRRTIADLEAENYAGGLAELAHAHNLQLSIEAYANGPFDNLLYAARADLPMGEFWAELDDFSRFNACKSMASAAHVYGKPIIPAEAFTSYPATAKSQNHPWSLKALGDAAFCEGINRLVIHRFAHQPWLDRPPGMTMGHFGVHYERTQTWWEQSGPWHEYLARCQFLLQRGRPAADICYLTDEGAFAEPPTRERLEPPLPEGYDYDVATPEAVLNRMRVEKGRLVLPDGVSYAVLVLPQTRRMTPGLLQRVQELVAAGALVVGPPPTNSPSLVQYPGCDQEVQTIAASLWRAGTNQVGPARAAIQNRSLADVLEKLGPDFQQLTRTTGFPLRWIHRSFDEGEVYFVANSNAQPVTADCAFRVTGKWPEIWHPDTGRIEKAVMWQALETRLALKLDPGGSCFVVFREPASSFDPVIKFSRGGRPETNAVLSLAADGKLQLLAAEAGTYEATTRSGWNGKVEVPRLPRPPEVSGPWEVRFPPNLGAPAQTLLPQLISWSRHSDPGIKYFSGQATYRKVLKLGPDLLSPHRRLYLDLGKVQVIAQVRVNGHDLGVLWKPPFTVELTGSARVGDNELEIKVTNLWPNRLIGDEQLPDDCQWGPRDPAQGAPLAAWPGWLLEGKRSPTGRIAFSTWKHWFRDSPLLESGLLGPVTLRVAQEVGVSGR